MFLLRMLSHLAMRGVTFMPTHVESNVGDHRLHDLKRFRDGCFSQLCLQHPFLGFFLRKACHGKQHAATASSVVSSTVVDLVMFKVSCAF